MQTMRATEKVDYLKVKYKLLEALKKKNWTNDFDFDWCAQPHRKLSPPKESKSKKKINLSPEGSARKKEDVKPAEDTARKKKEEQKMREENQQIVQHDIYEVYKFIEKDKN